MMQPGYAFTRLLHETTNGMGDNSGFFRHNYILPDPGSRYLNHSLHLDIKRN